MRVCYLERWTPPTVASGVPSGLPSFLENCTAVQETSAPTPSLPPPLRSGRACLAGQLLSEAPRAHRATAPCPPNKLLALGLCFSENPD